MAASARHRSPADGFAGARRARQVGGTGGSVALFNLSRSFKAPTGMDIAGSSTPASVARRRLLVDTRASLDRAAAATGFAGAVHIATPAAWRHHLKS